jgi:hypothetical protein
MSKADYEFVVDGRSFPVHKIILAARCSHLTLAEVPALLIITLPVERRPIHLSTSIAN